MVASYHEHYELKCCPLCHEHSHHGADSNFAAPEPAVCKSQSLGAKPERSIMAKLEELVKIMADGDEQRPNAHMRADTRGNKQTESDEFSVGGGSEKKKKQRH
jgi:hypothetical protein